jgi:hypothetical protein
MKISHFICRNVCLFWFGLAVLANAAFAGSGSCTDTCTRWCGGSSSPCLVNVSEDSGGLTLSREPICVKSGTKITWYTTKKHSTFTVTFTTHPFAHFGPNVTFIGDDNDKPDAVGDTTKVPPGTSACYKYSATHQINNGSIASLDPKVIVSNVRVPPKRHEATGDAVKK